MEIFASRDLKDNSIYKTTAHMIINTLKVFTAIRAAQIIELAFQIL